MTTQEQYKALADAGQKIIEGMNLLKAVWALNKDGASLEYEFDQLHNSVIGTEKSRGIIEILMKRVEEKQDREHKKL